MLFVVVLVHTTAMYHEPNDTAKETVKALEWVCEIFLLRTPFAHSKPVTSKSLDVN